VIDRPPPQDRFAGVDEAVVYVIDDDASMREALSSLFRQVGLRVQGFGTAQELLRSDLPASPSCLVLDIRLPGLSGLDLQTELINAGIGIPIIFMTAHGDIPMSVKAMKAGALNFLTKPFRDQEMLDAVTAALDWDRARLSAERIVVNIRSLYGGLTPRERQVMDLVTAGMLNKLIATEIGISEITVKIHRRNVMRKMGAKSLTDLVRMADTLKTSGAGRAQN
jgi:FixJ family two-component response regulator